ncbi:glycosyltransferase family 2 protein [Flavobacterium zhairuonense]|uniref:glycosyltransferase family 2 protein n=1 Tax=Flavobacterium zhairuonense TaxID=2493631 RepID=UPI00104ECC5A|nr:glycosyltransferase family A protein [Flavobacterium zhairuonense]KAF2510808.1 glycosyltransferase family 2 protein [Flavobacterium zhairuonense]
MQKNSSLISIIIPCYNDYRYVEQAINSALNQTHLNKEVIVVDDGSNLDTKEVLKRLEPKITKLITQENQGQSKARNIGIEASEGKYILVLDSDDFFDLSFCQKAMEIFLNSEDAKLVTCQANLLFKDGSSRIFTPNGGGITDFIFGNSALGTSMFKKADWNACGGYDEDMRNGFEDWEFFIRLLKNGGQAVVIPEPLYTYRKRNYSTTSIANSKKYELLAYVFNKNKTLYIENFELYTDYLLKLVQKEEIEKKKKMNSIDYKIGTFVLKPFRIIKLFFK